RVGAAPPAKASEATVTNIAVRESVMSFHPVCAIAPRQRLAKGDTNDAACGCRRFSNSSPPLYSTPRAEAGRERAKRMMSLGLLTYRFVSLPAAITGPVGRPVGDPPGGSSETASVASGVTRLRRSEGISSLIG